MPQTMHDAQRELLISFIIFAVSALIGAVSAANDQEFVRLIMGNQYVDMTLDNIARGEPMAVYNGSPEAPMFLGITINNIKVSFLCFAAGILTSFGTVSYTHLDVYKRQAVYKRSWSVLEKMGLNKDKKVKLVDILRKV